MQFNTTVGVPAPRLYGSLAPSRSALRSLRASTIDRTRSAKGRRLRVTLGLISLGRMRSDQVRSEEGQRLTGHAYFRESEYTTLLMDVAGRVCYQQIREARPLSV